jgi:5-methylthioribose kinase
MAIDFEVIHYGDPSFDAGFLLSHLLLKSFHLPDLSVEFAELARAFWTSLISGMPPASWFEPATIAHIGGLLLARVDGKSPAEYIRQETRQHVRDFARRLILEPPTAIRDVFEIR